MNITDYIHFYVGAKILSSDGTVGIMTGTRAYDDPNDDVSVPVVFYKNKDYFGKTKIINCKFKLLLIPITKLTQDDFGVLDYPGTFTLEEFKEHYDPGMPHLSVEDVCYLIKQGYDVFRLIEEGYAIDITETEYAKV